MAVTATWNLYSPEPNFGNAFIDVPYLNIKFDSAALESDLRVVSLKLFGSEAKYAEVYLLDEFADIYYTNGTVETNVNLLSKSMTFQVARFWVKTARAASTTNITATYNNGIDGVGATLTGTGQLVLDTIAVSKDDIVLIKNQNNAAENGVYVVRELTANTWKLVRTDDADTFNEISDMLVVVQEPTTSQQAAVNWIVDINPTTMGSSNINFQKIGTTTAGDVKTIDSHFTDRLKWVNILKRSDIMATFMLNDDAPYEPDGATLNPNYTRPLTLNQGFMALSNLLAIKMTRNSSSFNAFNIKNIKMTAKFRTKEPFISPRPVKIMTAPGIPVIQDTNQIEYYSPTVTNDNLNYNTGTTWTSNDSIEVFIKPLNGVITPVNSSKYIYSGETGIITFLQRQNSDTIVYVTITRPLVTSTAPAPN